MKICDEAKDVLLVHYDKRERVEIRLSKTDMQMLREYASKSGMSVQAAAKALVKRGLENVR